MLDHYAASYGQESLWQKDGLSAINVPAVVRLRHVTPERVQDMLNVLCARHDAFRTILVRDGDGVLRQQVAPTGWLDLNTVDHSDGAEALGEILLAGAERPFPVDGGALSLAELHTFGSGHLLVVWMHHAVADLASSQVVADDLRHLFQGTDPGPVHFQMGRFGELERSTVVTPGLARYWQETVVGADREIGLPRPPGRMHRGIRPALPRLSIAQVDALTLLAAEQRTTITAVFVAAMVACHAPEATADRVLVGLTKSNRDHPRLRSTVGCLADQLPLVVDVGGDPTFPAFVGRVREALLDAFDHRAPLGALLPVFGLERAPVFTLNLNFLPPRPGPAPEVDFPAGLVKTRPDPWWLGEAVVDYRPRLDRQGMGGEIEGDAYVHDPETIAWFGERFSTLLATVADVPALRLSELTATVRAR